MNKRVHVHSTAAELTNGLILPVSLRVVLGTVLFIFVGKVKRGSGVVLQRCHLHNNLYFINPCVRDFRISCPTFEFLPGRQVSGEPV